jgi:branched-chain amino acid transport system ATP-binding protein
MPTEPILNVQELGVAYGQVRAVAGVNFVVREGEAVAILGANGAGKSSIVKAVVGLVRAAEGRILLDGKPAGHLSSDRRAALGVALVPEGRRVFADLTVRENLLVGATLDPRGAKPRLAEVEALFPRLAERRQQLAGTLSGGEQQMLAIGRALMRRPRLLVMDEPSLGLSPILVQTIYQAIAALHRQGITLLLAEQSAAIALQLADRAVLLETGQVVLEGAAAALRADARVREAYLGLV